MYNITVLIASLNASRNICNLLTSLESQKFKEFKVIIIDGCSNDNTLEIISNYEHSLDIYVQSSPDFSIYHALNKGIGLIKTEYYIVAGSDDIFFPSALGHYNKLINLYNSDIICSAVKINKKTIYPRTNLGWLYGMVGISSCHSLGLLIRKSLHFDYGLYSNKFPIAADQYFIKKAIYAGATVTRDRHVTGLYSSSGFSGSDKILMISDLFRVQFLTERLKILQILLMFLRVLKFYLYNK